MHKRPKPSRGVTVACEEAWAIDQDAWERLSAVPMHKKPKPALRVTVAWECPACGAQHLWKWKREDAVGLTWTIYMCCDKCDSRSAAVLKRIGHDTWAAAW